MLIVRYFILSVIFVFSIINATFSAGGPLEYLKKTNIFDCARGNCLQPNDNGGTIKVVVEANPALQLDNGYTRAGTSQKAMWKDPVVRLNGAPVEIKISDRWTSWYGGNAKNTKYAPRLGDYCIIKTTGQPETIGNDGHLDYIVSSRYLQRANGNTGSILSNVEISAFLQKPCVMVGGEGMYIGFFGPMGIELPMMATHMKTVDVVCDPQYFTDKNDDGIIDISDCYAVGDKTRTVMAYFRGSYNESNSTTTFASCPNNEYLHGTRFQKDEYKANGKLYINTCWLCSSSLVRQCPPMDWNSVTTTTGADGSTIKTDKYGTTQKTLGKNTTTECLDSMRVDVCNGQQSDMTEFIFKTDYFFKNPDTKEKVEAGQRPKFIIYDKYYGDNSGQYTMILRGGFSEGGDAGMIEAILTDLEQVFIGKFNEYGQREGGILQQFYNRIVRDSYFGAVVRISCVLYICFLGYMFLFGLLKWELKEYMQILLELTFVICFTSYTSWEIYNRFIVSFFLNGMTDIMMFLSHTAMNVYTDQEYQPAAFANNIMSVFRFIDDYIKSMFSKERSVKIWGLFFGVWYGFIAIPILYYILLKFIYKLINATFPFIIQFIQVVLALVCGPVIIFLYLFRLKKTKKIFNNWVAFLVGRFVNMTFLFVFINMFVVIIRRRIDELTGVCACKDGMMNVILKDGDSAGAMTLFSLIAGLWIWILAIFNPPVWHSVFGENNSKQPGIFEFAVGILGVLILIEVFDNFLKQAPTIIDNMISIGGSEGGGLGPAGAGSNLGNAVSKAGGGNWEGLFNQVKVNTTDKDGKTVEKGLTQVLDKDGKAVDFSQGGGSALLNLANEKAGEALFVAGVGDGSSLTSQAKAKVTEFKNKVMDDIGARLDPGIERENSALETFDRVMEHGKDGDGKDAGNINDARDASIANYRESITKQYPNASKERIDAEVNNFTKSLDGAIAAKMQDDSNKIMSSITDSKKTGLEAMEEYNSRMSELGYNGLNGPLADKKKEMMAKAGEELKLSDGNARNFANRQNLDESCKRLGINETDLVERSKKLREEEEALLKKAANGYGVSSQLLKQRLLNNGKLSEAEMKVLMSKEDADKLLSIKKAQESADELLADRTLALSVKASGMGVTVDGLSDGNARNFANNENLYDNVAQQFSIQGMTMEGMVLSGTNIENVVMQGISMEGVVMGGTGMKNIAMYNDATGEVKEVLSALEQAAEERKIRAEMTKNIEAQKARLAEILTTKVGNEAST